MKKTTKIKNEDWEWEETSEVREALKRLHSDIREGREYIKKEEQNEPPHQPLV